MQTLAKRRVIALTLVGVAIFAIYLAWANPFAAFTEIQSFDFTIYAAAIVIDQIGMFFFALSWYLILRAMKVKVGLWGTMQVCYTSFFIGWIAPIPLITEFVRMYLIRDKSSANAGEGLSSVLLHRSYYNIAFGLIIGGTVFITLASGREILIDPVIVGFLTLSAFATIVLFTLMLNTRFLSYVYGKSPQWAKKRFFDKFHDPESKEEGFRPVIGEVGESVKALSGHKLYSALAFGMLMFHWAAGAVTAYLSAEALGVHIDVATVVFAFAVVEFIQQVNIFIPSGLGVLDAGLTGVFVLAGVPLSTAAAISLLTRVSTYWLKVLICAPIAIGFGYKKVLDKYFKDEVK